mgnify:CR=1 FL=1
MKIEKLTKKQIELQAQIRDEWIDIALHKQDFDKEEIEAGVKWLYYISNLKEPKIVIVDGPKDFSAKFSASVGASVGASVWASVRASVDYACLSGDAEFGAYYEYWKKIKAIEPNKKSDKYIGYLKSGAFYVFFFKKVAFVMIRPTTVKQNERKQLHSITDPALAFKDGTEIYKINGVQFEKEWWTKIVNDQMTPEEIFAIDNMEHRRVAYEFMDKTKMKSLKDYKVLDEIKDDSYGYPMKVISFTIKQLDEPLKYLNCFCPSSGREYFLGTDKYNCIDAKAASFGLDKIKFLKEW